MSTSCKNSIADNTDDNNNTGDEKFIHFLQHNCSTMIFESCLMQFFELDCVL
jgi:hypothetical protein